MVSTYPECLFSHSTVGAMRTGELTFTLFGSRWVGIMLAFDVYLESGLILVNTITEGASEWLLISVAKHVFLHIATVTKLLVTDRTSDGGFTVDPFVQGEAVTGIEAFATDVAEVLHPIRVGTLHVFL